MFLCIEMGIFSVLHLWAFSWKPYRINSAVNASESVPGYAPTKASYQGGFLGFWAIIEAFNVWDLFKAIGRGGRWLFVGRKHRMDDPSYKTGTNSTVGLGLQSTNAVGGFPPPDATSYGGGLPVGGGKPVRYAASDVSEGEELLSHAQSNPMSLTAPPAYERGGDIGMAASQYNDDDRRMSWERSRDASFDGRNDQINSQQYPRGGIPPINVSHHDDVYRGTDQHIGVTSTTPYPDDRGRGRGQDPVQMPYFVPPPSDAKRDRDVRRGR